MFTCICLRVQNLYFLTFAALQNIILPLRGGNNILSMIFIISTTSLILVILNRVRRIFAADQLHVVLRHKYNSMKYDSHLWDGFTKSLFDAVDTMQRQFVRICFDFETLQQRREIASLSIFYSLYHEKWSKELFKLISSTCFIIE